MNIETDGTITPKEAVEQAVKILEDHLNLLKIDEVKEENEEKK
jgi:DNA-directed RNA polymerase alpha subunit